MANHLVLLGDSIFDNAAYVGGAPAVIDQVGQLLSRSPDWQASLLAIDGSVTTDVQRQIRRLPADATHLVLSVGGNDALGALAELNRPATSLLQALDALSVIQLAFEVRYVKLLDALCELHLPLLVCTIYDQVPGLTPSLRTALSLFNDVITRTAASLDVTVLDLRTVCTEADDYSTISPIEPSSIGGQKLAVSILNKLKLQC